jgi:hypothetical protein
MSWKKRAKKKMKETNPVVITSPPNLTPRISSHPYSILTPRQPHRPSNPCMLIVIPLRPCPPALPQPSIRQDSTSTLTAVTRRPSSPLVFSRVTPLSRPYRPSSFPISCLSKRRHLRYHPLQQAGPRSSRRAHRQSDLSRSLYLNLTSPLPQHIRALRNRTRLPYLPQRLSLLPLRPRPCPPHHRHPLAIEHITPQPLLNKLPPRSPPNRANHP